MIIHIIAALAYTFRVVAFFLWLADDSAATRTQYSNYHNYTFIPLGLAGIAITVMRWVEWGHVPTWTLISWVLNIGFNIYHAYGLMEFASLPVSTSTVPSKSSYAVVEDDQPQVLLSDANIHDLRRRAVEILSNSME